MWLQVVGANVIGIVFLFFCFFGWKCYWYWCIKANWNFYYCDFIRHKGISIELGPSSLEWFSICYEIKIPNDWCRLLLVVTAHLFTTLLLQVNFSYFEAGENKQALVKLVTCERLVAFLYAKVPISISFPLSDYVM